MKTIKLSHIYPVDTRFFASFNVSDGNHSSMKTFGYDGQWFYIGGGSADYIIGEVKLNPTKYGGKGDFWFKPKSHAIDHIFSQSFTSRMPVDDTYTKVLMSTLRDYKIDKILR